MLQQMQRSSYFTTRPLTSRSLRSQTQEQSRRLRHSTQQQSTLEKRDYKAARDCAQSTIALQQQDKLEDSKSTGRQTANSANNFSSKSLVPYAVLCLLLSSALSPESCLAANNGLFAIADIDPKTAGLIATILSPILTLSILLFIFRIPMSWYPNLNYRKFPWALVVVPTEPVLGPTRKAVPPVGGVDIAPIIWVAVLSFVNEILLGPQGILNLIQRQLQV